MMLPNTLVFAVTAIKHKTQNCSHPVEGWKWGGMVCHTGTVLGLLKTISPLLLWETPNRYVLRTGKEPVQGQHPQYCRILLYGYLKS